jgi:hypothetical protein
MEGTKVRLVGFMVPIDLDYSALKVKSFALTQNIAYCCYGVAPKINELVLVEMKDKRPAEYLDNVPIAVYGTFSVGEKVDDVGMVSLYQLAADEVRSVRELDNPR